MEDEQQWVVKATDVVLNELNESVEMKNLYDQIKLQADQCQ